ncbi:MAG: PQQ-dependent sugar dehydrogenase [Candidatus Paceibacterota bacterium]
MSKQTALILLIAIIISIIFFVGYSMRSTNKNEIEDIFNNEINEEEVVESEQVEPVDVPLTTVISENLSVPWGVAFLPEGDLLVTERPGRLVRIGENGAIYTIDGVEHVGEGGLLGVALHPEFSENRLVYLYLTTRAEGALSNKIERYRLSNDELENREIIFSGIPGARNHDGGRIAFGPDGKLYVTTGDAQNESSAQDTSVLSGKILRINDDGTIPSDNPFGNAVWSYGHRNPQGLGWSDDGTLYSTEHGRSGILSGFDEINIIERGQNYGWPVIQGDETQAGMVSPLRHSGGNTTWAPASAAYLNGSLYFGGLMGRSLYEAVVSGNEVVEMRVHFNREFGRIRTVGVGPDGMLYITTSNTDGRGSPFEGDDKIIRVNPDKL